ncbi:MAG TPA: ribonuclease HI family protein [Methanolinea sp.]|jgi:ribonuclease HI|nr:MAG: Ribonuclease HI [Methanoregulaceae archaeon PtaB.Bin009]OPY41463.1 MAG: Ribonuclease HI [Methanoregulaceae archaeon PtaU1.Bin066]HII76023.1 ribonuclease HI family protein [Methanolinea sp.]HNQ29482.1 ribonuclease HI family protein [Methanolinea sp.]
MMAMTLYGYTDGASRGNPGPAACAFLLRDQEGRLLAKEALVLGTRTNNEAEYHAVIEALRKAGSFASRNVVIYSDSQLVVRQLRGEYQVRKPHLRELHGVAKDLERSFLSVEYRSVGRDDPWITMADRLCNEALDSANA